MVGTSVLLVLCICNRRPGGLIGCRVGWEYGIDMWGCLVGVEQSAGEGRGAHVSHW